jgi:NAD(P)-dependent dehydrogenase (short-subunit alcohol dehydrogenase family)/acyl dehydratase
MYFGPLRSGINSSKPKLPRPMLSSKPIVRFSEQHLALFSVASGDYNPLHLSDAYASRTPYGQQVVYGVLGAFACIAQRARPDSECPAEITIDFLRPMFIGVDYRVQQEEKDGKQVLSLSDGSVAVLTLTARGIAHCPPEPFAVEPAACSVTTAAQRNLEDTHVGMEVRGSYCCNLPEFQELLRMLSVTSNDRLAAVLCWASYAVGMELPGESALFRRLIVKFEDVQSKTPSIEYDISVSDKRDKLGQITCQFTLRSDGAILASGRYEALFRPQSPTLPDSFLPVSKGMNLQGLVALVIGGSRGLGAATCSALEAQGARVFKLSRSGAGPSTEQGDAQDLEFLLGLRKRILAQCGRLDLLVCNASPSLHALRLEPNFLERIQHFLARAIGLVSTPLSVFLEPLQASKGRLVVISSVAVQEPVREWPHYVAAKSAIEALARVAVLQYPGIEAIIVRPSKLLTDMTNTPLGRSGAMPPQIFAQQLVERLGQPIQGGVCDIFPTVKVTARGNER